MDNTVQALYMAAAVLVFMLAVSLTLSSFSTFRNDLEDIILAEERVDAATITEEEGGETKTRYINYISSSNEVRTVGIETLANSLFRVFKENYTVVIKLKNEHNEYDEFTGTGSLVKYSNLLLKGNGFTIISGDNKPNVKKQEYKGTPIIKEDDKILVFDIPSAQNDKEYINKALDAGLYKLLKDKTFTEYTGVYYETDTVPIGTTTSSGSNANNAVSSANKNKARVITYIEK